MIRELHPLPCPSSSVVPPASPTWGLTCLQPCSFPFLPRPPLTTRGSGEGRFQETKIGIYRLYKGQKGQERDVGKKRGFHREEVRPVLLGNKDGWMIGSNPSLRSFHIAPCSVPWHFLLTSLLFIHLFGNIQNGKKMQKKNEMVGVRKKCQGIFFFFSFFQGIFWFNT